MWMPMNTSLAPFKQVLRKICMFKPRQSREPLPCHFCSRALSRGIAPLELPYLLAHPIKVILSILESSRHELRITHGLTLVTPSLCEWEAFPMPRALTYTRLTWALSTTPQVSGVTLGSPLCPWCFRHSSWRGARHL